MKKHHPPILATRLLKWYAGKAEMEDLEGDLDELFQQVLEESGRFKASVHYWSQIHSLVFSYALKKRKRNSGYSNYYQTNSIAMLKNYFKIAIRNFSKQKSFTIINMAGLALGMSLCLLALSITVAIYRSDEFHVNKYRTYQINTYMVNPDESKTYGSTFHAVGDYLKEKYPFIEEVVKIRSGLNLEIDHRGNEMNFDGYFAGEPFFDVFSFELIEGNPASVLSDPYSVVLTQSMAETLYKNDNPIGQMIETDLGSFTVTGVMKDLKQTHFYFKMLVSYSTLEQLQSDMSMTSNWTNYRNNYVYCMLKEGSEISDLKEALIQTSEEAATFNPDYEVQLEYIDLASVVPRWNVSNAIGIGWDQPSIVFFMFLGLLILLPAVFNYTNLSIARALKRAKEIGVRKVVGAEKSQIKAQFIVETIILTFLALIGSVLIFIPLKEEFLDMVRAAEVLDTSMGIYQIGAFIFFALFVGFFAGMFPARFFAKLNPIHTIKGDFKAGGAGVSGIKKGLFVFQFMLSLFFIIGISTIARQYSYVLNNNHGFESDNILAIPFQSIDKQLALNELGNHPDVKAITASSHLPGLFLSSEVILTHNDVDTIPVSQVFIGDDFIPNLQMKLSWGESVSLSNSNSTEELVLVNQAYLRSIKVFNTQGDSLTFTLENGKKCRIAGILEDFNFEPLSELINPIVFRYSLEQSNYALLTINTPNIKNTITELDFIWTEIDQNADFEATFLDDEIEDAYFFLRAQMKIFGFLSTMAITISCLGLLGMVSYTTENRTKEIAVRKIMGASTKSLYYLLTRDFIKLIMIAALIGIPVSYIFYDKLFLYFLIRYGNGLGFIEVFLSILFLFLIGFFSIYFQTSKITRANPATKLRYE